MTVLLSSLIGVSATMAGMVGGFLVLRHTRIRTEIQDSVRRHADANVELEALQAAEPTNDPATGEGGENTPYAVRISALKLAAKKERELSETLEKRMGRISWMFFWWGMMIIAGVLVPAWLIASPLPWALNGWGPYLVWLDYLAVVLMMFLTVWAALQPLTAPLPERMTRGPSQGPAETSSGFRKDPRTF